mgnify:CR=1 FL=1
MNWIKDNGSTLLMFLVLVFLIIFSLVEPQLKHGILGRKTQATVSFVEAEMIHLQDGQPVFHIFSDRANLFSFSSKVVFFNAKGKYIENDTMLMSFFSPMAEFDQMGGRLELIDCRLSLYELSEQTVVVSDYLSWDMTENLFLGYERTRVESDSIYVEGDLVQFHVPIQTFKVEGNGFVRIKI